jgi:hypothetical protein
MGAFADERPVLRTDPMETALDGPVVPSLLGTSHPSFPRKKFKPASINFVSDILPSGVNLSIKFGSRFVN